MNCVNTKYLIILSLLLAVLSCTRHSEVSDTLAHADAVMEQHPDSALALLEAIPDSALVTSRDRALHALLLTQALDKNYIDVTSDSLINIAVNYFQNHGSKEYLMKALFYLSRIDYNIHHYRQSMMSSMESERISTQLNNPFWSAKNQELQADIYAQNFNRLESYKQRVKAAVNYKISGKKLNEAYSLVEAAVDLSNGNKFKESIRMLDSISMHESLKNQELNSYYESAYLAPLYYTGQDSLLERKIFLVDSLSGIESLEAYDYLIILQYAIHKEQIDKANEFFKEAIKKFGSKDPSVMMMKYIMAQKSGDYRLALEAHRKLFLLKDSLAVNILSMQVGESQRDYYKNLNQIESHKKIQAFYFVIFLMIIISILIIGFILFYRERLKRKNLEIFHQMSEMRELLKSLDIQKSETQESKKIIEYLYKSKFSSINSICEKYFDWKDDNSNKEKLYSAFKSELSHISDKDSLLDLENVVNQCYNNIIFLLRTHVSSLNEEDLKILVMVFSRLSTRSICLLLNLSKVNFYSKIKRIKYKIQNSKYSNKDFVLQTIMNTIQCNRSAK